MVAIALLLLSLSGVLTARVRLAGDFVDGESETARRGKVDHLFTFGAPHPTHPKLTTKSGGCYKGFRITAFSDKFIRNEEDIVPTLLVPSKYNHPNINTIGVSGKSTPFVSWSCGKNPIRVTKPKIYLHSQSLYGDRMKKLSSSYTRAKDASRLGLAISYKGKSEAKSITRREGWNYVGFAAAGEDVSHLVQDRRSKRCILTFEGSDRPSDFVTDAKVKRVSFCNLNKYGFHLGFRNELLRMVGSSSWQTNIRKKLGKCSSVDAVGHSLGGAVATLFTACIEHQNGSSDYNKMYWNVGTPSLLPSI